jgi:hypothetical protein
MTQYMCQRTFCHLLNSLCTHIGIVARAHNAANHVASRSQRITKRRYCFCNQVKARSAWNRGTEILIGLPRGFLVFHTRFGICGRIPRWRRC